MIVGKLILLGMVGAVVGLWAWRRGETPEERQARRDAASFERWARMEAEDDRRSRP